MYFDKEFDANSECRPSFEQLSHERIVNEANKNASMLKSLESMIADRLVGFNALYTTLSKMNSQYELLDNVEGTLRVAMDSMFVFSELEAMQCKQNVFLGDLKKSINEVKSESQRRMMDYQKEINSAEKDVVSAEKKLMKSKEILERTLDHKNRYVFSILCYSICL
jgi:PDZ domain-containing secreted protein